MSQPIEMILSALAIVDNEAEEAKQSSELRKLNSDMVCAIISRPDEILKLPLSLSSMLFGNISRFIAIMDEG